MDVVHVIAYVCLRGLRVLCGIIGLTFGAIWDVLGAIWDALDASEDHIDMTFTGASRSVRVLFATPQVTKKATASRLENSNLKETNQKRLKSPSNVDRNIES